jgi:hypothetical protein
MFKCQICGEQQPVGVHVNKVVLATRPKEYPQRYAGAGASQRIVDQGGVGTEIVREVNACGICAIKVRVG